MSSSPHGFFVERKPDGAPLCIGRKQAGRLHGLIWMARGARDFPDCPPKIESVFYRYNQGFPQDLRYFDEHMQEHSRAGKLLRKFDLDPLFDAGSPDSFIEDGRVLRFFDALLGDDKFLPQQPRSWGWAPPGPDQELFGQAPPAWLETWRLALSRHPQRVLVGLMPLPGVSTGQFDPYGARSVLESGLNGVIIGQFLLGDSVYPRELADLVALRERGLVLAVSPQEPWRVLGACTVGALCFAACALTGFEARRVSWQALQRVNAGAVGLEPYLPALSPDPESIPALHLLLRDPNPLSLEQEARIAWLRQLGWPRAEEDETLPELPPAEDPPPPQGLSETLYLLARSYFISDDERLAQALAAARSSSSTLLHRAAERVERQLRGGGETYSTEPLLGGLYRPREAREALSARWKQAHGPLPAAPSLGDSTPEELAEMAWALVQDTVGLQRLRKELLPRHPTLNTLLSQIEALPMFSATAELAWELRQADAQPLAPFLAALAQDGELAAAHTLCRDMLAPWVRGEPRWGPIARAFARDPRFGAQRLRWLCLAGDGQDVDWLVALTRAHTQRRSAMREAIGFEWDEAFRALISLSPPQAELLLLEALALELLYPPERLRLAMLLAQVNPQAALPELLLAQPPLNAWVELWPYTGAMLRVVPLLTPPQQEQLRARLEGAQANNNGALARRILMGALGQTGPDAAELCSFILRSDSAVELLQALHPIGQLPPEVWQAATEHPDPAVRLWCLDQALARPENKPSARVSKAPRVIRRRPKTQL